MGSHPETKQPDRLWEMPTTSMCHKVQVLRHAPQSVCVIVPICVGAAACTADREPGCGLSGWDQPARRGVALPERGFNDGHPFALGPPAGK